MRIDRVFDVICAAHLTAYVRSPFESRGGILFVAAGESLKTSLLDVLEYYHPQALVQTDITVQGLAKLRDQIANGNVHSVVLTDFQKIYERAQSVSANVEGTLRALVAEGFTSTAFQESQINRMRARAMVFGAITPTFLESRFRGWQDSGFARRFLFPLYRLKNPELLIESVIERRLIDLGRGVIPPPRNRMIPFSVTREESEELRDYVRYQYGGAIPLQLMQKILAVLKWHYLERAKPKADPAQERRRAMATIREFAESLRKEGAELELTLSKANGARERGED